MPPVFSSPAIILPWPKPLQTPFAPRSANGSLSSLVQYDAVCDALDSGHLWESGFDVFPKEPPAADSRLLRTPHIVGASKQTAEKAAKIAAEEVRRYLAGEPSRNCANPEVAEGRAR